MEVYSLRIIISIISDQPLPNYVFIKEKAQKGDILVFIVTKSMEKKYEEFKLNLNQEDFHIRKIEFDNIGDEDDYIPMYQFLEAKLKNVLKDRVIENDEFIVNLTGGTKQICIATRDIMMKNFKYVKFFYKPINKNSIISFDCNEYSSRLKYRVSVNEYLGLFGINNFTNHSPVESEKLTNTVFDNFMKLSESDYDIIDELRTYRDKDRKTPYRLDDIERKGYGEKKKAVPKIRQLLEKLGYECVDNELSALQIDFLTGGWFEEYCFYLIKRVLNPNDIMLNLNIKDNKQNLNELDVIFTLGNNLYAVECKTGIERIKDFKEIANKAVVLNNKLGRIGSKPYIFSLESKKEDFVKYAEDNKIGYFDKTYLYDEREVLEKKLLEIKHKAEN